jgi:hypothetical protein
MAPDPGQRALVYVGGQVCRLDPGQEDVLTVCLPKSGAPDECKPIGKLTT